MISENKKHKGNREMKHFNISALTLHILAMVFMLFDHL